MNLIRYLLEEERDMHAKELALITNCLIKAREIGDEVEAWERRKEDRTRWLKKATDALEHMGF